MPLRCPPVARSQQEFGQTRISSLRQRCSSGILVRRGNAPIGKDLVMQIMRRHETFSRRQFFEAAGLAGLGLVADTARGAHPVAAPAKRIRSCILIFYYGGPSHLDTWDPK